MNDRKEPLVLVVDDSAVNLELLAKTLKGGGYSPVVTQDPGQVVDYVRRRVPDLVLLDVMMPEMDGLEVCRRLKADARTRNVPVVFITALANTEDKVRGFEAGGEDYITKPFVREEVLARVRVAVEQHRTQDELRARRAELQEANDALARKNRELETALEERRRAEQALAEARRKEMEVESRIEETLLRGGIPQGISGASVGCLSVPSQHMDGDFYECIDFHPRCFDVLMGDVMGKGIHAALVGAATKQRFLRTLGLGALSSGQGGPFSPEALVTRVHAEISPRLMELETFVTLCYARFDLDAGTLTFVGCGHTQVLHFEASRGRCALLEGKNMPLGFVEKEVHAACSAALSGGDLVLFYTDGITEAASPAGDLFGPERLTAFVRAHHALGPDELVRQLHGAVAAFAGGGPLQDDFTCVAVAVGQRAP